MHNDTLQTLREAQKAVEATGILPKYSNSSEAVEKRVGTGIQITSVQFRSMPVQQSGVPIQQSPKGCKATRQYHPTIQQTGADKFAPFAITKTLAVLPSEDFEVSTITSRSIQAQSLKSSSSTESFKSAKSVQEEDVGAAQNVKSIQSILHAFRTALQVLQTLIENRIREKEGQLFLAAKGLEGLLSEASEEIDQKHDILFRKFGQPYIRTFTGTRKLLFIASYVLSQLIKLDLNELQSCSSIIMSNIVMKLHEYSADDEELQTTNFYLLCNVSQYIQKSISDLLNQIARKCDHTFTFETHFRKREGPLTYGTIRGPKGIDKLRVSAIREGQLGDRNSDSDIFMYTPRHASYAATSSAYKPNDNQYTNTRVSSSNDHEDNLQDHEIQPIIHELQSKSKTVITSQEADSASKGRKSN